MARDPNALKYPESWKNEVEDLQKLPPPDGVNKAEWDAKIAGGDYYANVKVYANGRQVVEWYQRRVGGGPGQPDPVQARSEAILPTVKEEWDKEEEKPSATRVIGGVLHQVTGKDANGQDIWAPVQTTTGPATAATGTSTGKPRVPAGSVPRIEGTPDPSRPDGRDNSQPVRAWHAPDGSVTYEALTPSERLDWERQKNGGLTDKELREQNSPEARVGKPTGRTWTRSENGRTVKDTEYLLPDGTTETRSQVEQAQPDLVGKPTGATRVRTEGGQTIKEAQYILADGTKEWRGQTAPTEGLIKLPPGAPEVDLSSPETAYSTTLRYHQWLDARFRAGEMTAQQVKDAYEPAHTQAEQVINRAKEQRAQQQQQITNALTERAQDITQSATRLGSANTQFAEANRTAEAVGKLADPGMNATTNTRLGLLALQALHANAAGGMRDAPPVVPGPLANLPQYPGTPSVAPSVAAGAAAAAAPPTLASPEGQGLLAANEATRQAVQAEQAAGVPGIGAAPAQAPVPPLSGQTRDDWMRPTASSPSSPVSPPVSLDDPSYGVPTMALAGSFSGQHPYQGAIDSLKAAGMDDATIEQALGLHVRG
jgi:hypothetical protein